MPVLLTSLLTAFSCCALLPSCYTRHTYRSHIIPMSSPKSANLSRCIGEKNPHVVVGSA